MKTGVWNGQRDIVIVWHDNLIENVRAFYRDTVERSILDLRGYI